MTQDAAYQIDIEPNRGIIRKVIGSKDKFASILSVRDDYGNWIDFCFGIIFGVKRPRISRYVIDVNGNKCLENS